MKTFYRHRLPHLVPVGAAFFVTFRLGDSLPVAIVRELKADLDARLAQLPKDSGHKARYDEYKRHFARYDQHLDSNSYGKCHLKRPEIARIVIDRLHEFDGDLYQLIAYCIMPNHVHLLIDTMQQLILPDWSICADIPEDYVQLDEIMRLVKGASSRFANLELGRKGKFWQKESYDHYVRNEREMGNIVDYILNNPVKAGLAGHWSDWPFSYCSVDFSRQAQ